MHRSVEIIAAVDLDGGFASKSVPTGIPWKNRKDLKHFKDITSGHVCIMGRRSYEHMVQMMADRNKCTYEEEAAKDTPILPDRESYILTRNPDYKSSRATPIKSSQSVIDDMVLSHDPRKIFILGGERIWIDHFSDTDVVHLSIIQKRHGCDKRFPVNILTKEFDIVDGEQHATVWFLTYKRVRQPK